MNESADKFAAMQYHFAMAVTIDSAGRIVVPKKMRDLYDFHPGRQLDIVAEKGGVFISAAGSRSSLVRKDGVLVYHGGEGGAEIDIVEFIAAQRSTPGSVPLTENG